MAQISMCDRCGNMGLSTALGTMVYHTGPNTRTFQKELCPECISEFLVWFNENIPVRQPGVPFRDEYTEPVKELEAGDTVEDSRGVKWRMPKIGKEKE
jgi:hypothetical protein